MSNSVKRTRNWLFVCYPESVPENWIEILDSFFVEYVVSPLHDKDINPTGEPKKPHYHVLLLFDSVKSFEQVHDLLIPLNCTIPIACNSTKGTVRYFCHLDNPEKAQYSLSDIKCHGGFDLQDLLSPSSSEQGKILQEIFTFCRQNSVCEYSVLIDYILCNHLSDWFYIATRISTIAIKTYLSSMRHKFDKKVGE